MARSDSPQGALAHLGRAVRTVRTLKALLGSVLYGSTGSVHFVIIAAEVHFGCFIHFAM